MATEWYVKKADKEHGPLSSAQLKKVAKQGRIKPTTQVRNGKDGKWVAAAKIKGLFPESASTSDSKKPVAKEGQKPKEEAKRQPAATPSPASASTEEQDATSTDSDSGWTDDMILEALEEGGPPPAISEALDDSSNPDGADEEAHVCPSCREPLQANAVLCVSCGYDLRSGKKVKPKKS